MALTDNLISYWALDEASGTRVDSHGSNDLADNNTVGSGTGKISNAASFVRANAESLSIADNTDLSTGDIDFSISLWINPSASTSYPAILTKDDNGSQREYGFYIEASTQKVSFFVFSSGGTFAAAEWASALSTGTWYHVVGYHDSVNNVIGIAVNAGTPVTTAHSIGVRDGTAAFHIGIRGDGNEGYDGLIDEVGFWKKVLSSQERTDLYNGGSGLAYGSFGGGGGGGTANLLSGKLGMLLTGKL